jgi:protein involved in polysaccharide export with SLBB domain
MKINLQVYGFAIFATLLTLTGFASVNAYAEQTQATSKNCENGLRSIECEPDQIMGRTRKKVRDLSRTTPIESLSEAPPDYLPEGQRKPLTAAIEESDQQQPPSGLSSIEQYFTGKVSPEVPSDIKLFGYDLFKKQPSTFSPSGKVPVGPNYVVGPGDEIRIIVWGKFEGKWDVVVNRDGNIALPKVGIVGVTGLTFKELKTLLYKEFSRYYKGFEMNVSMGTLRTIRVYVVGNARSPGAYNISSLSTLINGLFEAGGPAKTGTMRDIQVKRNGKTIAHFDMYKFLLHGNKTADIRLMPEDVIFIPPIKDVAGITGNVNTPAIYELAGSTRLTDLIQMAGGATASAYYQRIQVERVYENEVKIVVDRNLKEIFEKADFILKDGDTIKIFPISSKIVNSITVKGNVLRPGEYQWFEGIRVSDIIKNPEKDLLPEAHFAHALIERYVLPDNHREMTSFNLGKALFAKDVKEDKLLKPGDVLTVYSAWEFRERPMVRIAGAVNKPGEFELKQNMTVSDLIKLSGGIKRYAFLEKAEITRVKITNNGPKTLKREINLKKVLANEPGSNFKLKQDDYLFVRTVPDWRLYRIVSVTGEVRFPGNYTIEKGEKLSSLIKRAGGFTHEAYLRGAMFTRESVKKQQQKTINEMVDRLERELLASGTGKAATALTGDEMKIVKQEAEQKRKFIESLRAAKAKGRVSVALAAELLIIGTPSDITLEDGDSLHIPEDPHVVYVAGSVFNQAAFLYEEDRQIDDYIEISGGFTKSADEDNVYILKANGSALKPGGGFLGLSWNSDGNRWEVGSDDLEAGDTIVVPENLERIAWLRNIKDITTIMFQIAVSAGILVAAL